MRKGLVFLMSILSVFLLGCESDKIGNDIYYLNSEDALDIGYPYGSIIYKSNIKNSFKKVLIYSDIEDVNYDKRFVIVKQVPNKKLFIKRINDDIKFWKDFYNNENDTVVNIIGLKLNAANLFNIREGSYKQYDSLFKKNKLFKKMTQSKFIYYLIDKENGTVSSFVHKADFDKFLNSKNISLKFVK